MTDDEILAALQRLEAGQAVLQAGQEDMRAEVRSELTAIRREVNDKFEVVAATLEGLSHHLGVRRAS